MKAQERGSRRCVRLRYRSRKAPWGQLRRGKVDVGKKSHQLQVCEDGAEQEGVPTAASTRNASELIYRRSAFHHERMSDLIKRLSEKMSSSRERDRAGALEG